MEKKKITEKEDIALAIEINKALDWKQANINQRKEDIALAFELDEALDWKQANIDLLWKDERIERDRKNKS